MKYKGLTVYKIVPKGDVMASDAEAKRAIKEKRLVGIGKGKTAYWLIQP